MPPFGGPLTPYQYPDNAMLNFQPLANAVADYGKGMESEYRGQAGRDFGNAMASKDTQGAMIAGAKIDPRLAMEAGAYPLKQEQMETSLDTSKIENRLATGKMLAGRSQLILGLPPDQQQKAWDAWRQEGPQLDAGLKKMGINPADPGAALPAIIAEAHGETNPTFGQTGEDIHGGKTFGFINVHDQSIKNTGGSDAAYHKATSAGLSGPAFLATLDAPTATVVKGLAEGRMAAPAGAALRSPYWQKIIELTGNYDPTFDASNYNARNKARSEFNAGGQSSPAAQITAGNTAIKHLSEVSDAAEALNNVSGAGPLNKTFNSIRNAYKTQSGTATELKAFDTMRERYISEITKFYRGSPGNEADLQRAIQSFDNAGSPQELQTVVKAEAALMRDKVGVLQQRWKQAMGPSAGDFPVLHDDSMEALTKIGKNYAKATGQPAPADAGGAKPNTGRLPQSIPDGQPGSRTSPVYPKTPEDAAKLPSGTYFLTPDGRSKVAP